MSFGITPTGFIVKDFQTIRNELQTEAIALYGANTDTRSTNPLMIHLDLIAAREQQLWNIINDLYQNIFVVSATGTALDLLAVNRGLTRNGAVKAQGSVTVTGTAGSIVTNGNIFTTSGDNVVRFFATQTKGVGEATESFASISSATQVLAAQAQGSFGTGQIQVTVGTDVYTEVASGPVGNQFSSDYASPTTITFEDASTKNNVTIEYFDKSATSDTIIIEAEFTGTEYNVGANQINSIPVPITGITEVTNPVAISGGTEIETDQAFRLRLIEVSLASWTESDLEAEIENITGVRSASIDDGEQVETLTSTGQTAESTWWKNDLAIATKDVFRATFYDDSAGTTTDLIATTTTVANREYWLDDSSGATTVIQYKGPNGSGSLDANDTLTVTYMDDAIGVGVFRAQIIPTSPPLTTTLRDTIESTIKLKKPFGVSFFVIEPTFSTINLSITIVLNTGFTVAAIEDAIKTEISAYFATIEVGETLYNARLIDIIMNSSGVKDVTTIAYEVDTETVVKGSAGGIDVLNHAPSSLPSTITDEDTVTYNITTDYLYHATGVDWSPGGSEPAQDKEYTITYSTADNTNVTASATLIIIEGTVTISE